mmetsp:Transcript_8727/g.27907  ORF Transcript_8727/g.27907 Transcript_8727/m.27907 type:complete len:112 (-) Transcript_8727:153-488(-)
MEPGRTSREGLDWLVSCPWLRRAAINTRYVRNGSHDPPAKEGNKYGGPLRPPEGVVGQSLVQTAHRAALDAAGSARARGRGHAAELESMLARGPGLLCAVGGPCQRLKSHL